MWPVGSGSGISPLHVPHLCLVPPRSPSCTELERLADQSHSVPAIVYSHSKHPNPNWTQSHPERAEIQKYWEQLAYSQGQRERIRLNQNIMGAKWDKARKLYIVEVKDLLKDEIYHVETDILVTASGGLSQPKYIDLPGEEKYKGQVVHAGDWPRDLTVESLKGKKVVVVGNGCSGVQVVATLGEDPEIEVVSLARARQWFVPSNPGEPRHSVPYSETRNKLWRNVPALMGLERFIMACVMDSLWYWYKEKDGKNARAKLQASLLKWYKAELPEYMHDALEPKHPYGSKRLIFEDGYFEALRKPNVKFVEGRIAALKEDKVVVDDGSELDADLVVLATGYDADTPQYQVEGSTDSTANYKARSEYHTYRGISHPGIPNYFNVLGNNMGLNHMGITTVIEIQTAYIGQLITQMQKNNIKELEVRKDATAKYEAWIERRLQDTTWIQVDNWWRGADGKGKIFTHYPGSVRRLWWEQHRPIYKDWIGADAVVRKERVRRVVFIAALIASGYFAKQHNFEYQSMKDTVVSEAIKLVATAKIYLQSWTAKSA